MTVILRQSNDLSTAGDFQSWLAVTGTEADIDPSLKLPDLARKLETSFEACRDLWWELGRKMADDPSAESTHAPTGGVYGSDFGLMLAWNALVEELASDTRRHIVVCDDPWLFRQIATLQHVEVGKPPGLFKKSAHLFFRGCLARLSVSFKSMRAFLKLRQYRDVFKGGEPTLLVYGHPASNAQGDDAYFGNLMSRFPETRRLVHVDCPAGRAAELSSGGRTASLHAWGSLWDAVKLITEFWSPRRELKRGRYGWLIRRAAAHENGGGGPAMVRWQIFCQRRWLKSIRPVSVIWPWENFSWERAMCRDAKALGIATSGYQHTAIGPHQLNYSIATNPDGLESLPDTIIANGPAYAGEMVDRKIPQERIVIGGSLRIRPDGQDRYDPAGPVYVPLSGQLTAARQQLQAARNLAEDGHQVRVKEHPMYPLSFSETENLKRTTKGLGSGVAFSGVLFTTGTSGLEAILAGIPAYRLLLEDRLCVNILPPTVHAPSVTIERVGEAFADAVNPPAVNWTDIFTEPSNDIWNRLLSAGPSSA